MKEILVLKSDDWEMFYINGILYDEGHTLNEGTERVIYFLNMSKKYDFNLEDIKWRYVTEEDQQFLIDRGSPGDLNELKGYYN